MKTTIRKLKETADIRSSVINRIRSHRYFPVLLLLSVILVAACFHIWQRVKVLELVRQVAQLQRERIDIVNEKKKLFSEISSLSMASRIERYAMDTLGLKPVSSDHLLTLVREKGKSNPPDKFNLMFSAIKRMADFMPQVSENQANARGIDKISINTEDGVQGEK